KVGAVLPVRLRITAEPQPGLVDERGRLQRLAGSLVGHLAGGQPTQLLIDDGQQFLGSIGCALLDGVEDARDIAHELRFAPCSRKPSAAQQIPCTTLSTRATTHYPAKNSSQQGLPILRRVE